MFNYSDFPCLEDAKTFIDNRGLLQVINNNYKNFEIQNVKATKSKFGVLRGFHGQLGKFAERKLITLLSGEIQDVCLEIDEFGNLTGNYFESFLDATAQPRTLFIPRGWVHAYLTLSEESILLYLCDNNYGNEIVFNPLKHYKFWRLKNSEILISEKDKNGN